ARNVVAVHHVPHPFFHAGNLVTIIGPAVLQPAGIIAVKTALVFRRKAFAVIVASVPVPAPIPIAATPIGSDPPIGSVRRNSVVLINVLHAFFHAGHFAAIVSLPVLLPALIVAVETALIVRREPALPRLRKGGKRNREHQAKY